MGNASDALRFISRCVRERKIYWTYHVNMRMERRFISRRMILESIDSYEIIEEYAEDKYLPSYLVYGKRDDVIFHAVFAIDADQDNVRVITAYWPDPGQWSDDMRRRKK